MKASTTLTWLLAIFLFEAATWAPIQTFFLRGYSVTLSPRTTVNERSETVTFRSTACGVRDDTPGWITYLYSPVIWLSQGPAETWYRPYQSWWNTHMPWTLPPVHGIVTTTSFIPASLRR